MLKHLLALVAFFGVVTAFAQGPSKEGPSALDDLFYKAETYRLTDRMAAAADTYARMLEKDPVHEAALYQLARIRFDGGDLLLAENLARRGAQAHPENEWMLRLHAQSLKKLGRWAQAADVFEELHRQHPLEEIYVREWLMARVQAEDWSGAQGALDALEGLVGRGPETVNQRALLWLGAGSARKAETALKGAVAEFPDRYEYVGLLGQFYEQQGKGKKALQVLLLGLEDFPGEPQLELECAKVYRDLGDYENSLRLLEQALSNPRLAMKEKASAFFGLLGAAEEDPSLAASVARIWAALEEHHGEEAPFLVMRAEYRVSQGDARGAMEDYTAAAEEDPENYELFLRALDIAQSEGLSAEGLYFLERFVETFPVERRMQVPLIFQAYSWGGAALCVELADRYVDEVLNPRERAQVLSVAGSAHFSLGQYDRGTARFEESLEEDSTAMTMNNYAWELSQAELALEKALELTEKSNALEPNTAIYLDTWAWVLHKMGRHAEALEKIEVALRLQALKADVELLEHAAEIAAAAGDEAAAAQYRRKADEVRRRD